MEISISFGPVTILSIKEDINGNTFPELVEQAEKVLNKGYVNLVLDLHGVNDINSSGLVALQIIVGRSIARGGNVVLCRVTRCVARILEIAGFTHWLTIFPDMPVAQASFAQGK
jgi:anti-anti-sigma factor